MAELGPKTGPEYWFVLEDYDEDARPPISEDDLVAWGGVPVPVRDRSALHPAHENLLSPGFPQEARLTLKYEDIAIAALAAGKSVEFPPNFDSITLAQRLGRLFYNVLNREAPHDYPGYSSFYDAEGGRFTATKTE